ncbi:MAG: MarR family transcriptional regulator [Cyclobacteriaceae bacterium]|nr:MarR family transcriptional regulator [Cyclobacteriaceae bacterium]
MNTPDSIYENTLYLIGEIGKTIRDNVIKTIRNEGYDITPEQFTILVLLYYKDGLNQQEIAKGVNRDKTTVSRVLNRMLKNKLIAKKSDSGDQRENFIYISQKGKVIQEKLINATGPIYLNALNNIPEKEVSNLNKTLLKILLNINNN